MPSKQKAPVKKTTKATPANRKSAPKKNKRSRTKRLLIGLLWSGLTIGILGLLAGISGYIYLVADLPDHRNYSFTETSKIYSSDGVKIGELFPTNPTVRRTVVPIADLPTHVIDAVLAAEDADFYTHKGLDYLGLIRAFYKMVTRGRIVGGGSTITQQTVKNMLLTPEKKFKRKFKELILATRLESSLTKDEILHLYLNMIYFGHGRNGIEEAAQFYFGIPASKLNLSQSTVIAGLIQSPEKLSPKKHPESSKKRQLYVLKQMVDKGFLGEQAAQEVGQAPLPPLQSVKRIPSAFRWFTDVVVKQLSAEYSIQDLREGGYTIHTTINSQWQLAAQNAIQEELDTAPRSALGRFKSGLNVKQWIRKKRKKLGKRGLKLGVVTNGLITKRGKKEVRVASGKGTGIVSTKAVQRLEKVLGRTLRSGDLIDIIIERPPTETTVGTFRLPSQPEAGFAVIDHETGDVKALIGGYDWNLSKFNRAMQMKRQVGSAFKPFVYGAALESRRYTLGTILNDSPETIHLGRGKYYKPKNYSGRYVGNINLRQALAKSVNTTAIRTAMELGHTSVSNFAKLCGLNGPFPSGPSLALGTVEISPLTLASAYGVFASGGRLAKPRLVQRIDRKGVTLQRFDSRVQKAIPDSVAFLMRDGLIEVVQTGTARTLRNIPETVGGKTGTTNKNRDAWFAGITPRLAGAVWVGRDNNQPLWKKATGGSAAAPIFKRFLENIEPGKLEFPVPPESVTAVRVDTHGFQVREEESQDHDSKARREYFLLGTEPELAPLKSQNLDDLFQEDQTQEDANAAGNQLPLFDAKTPNAAPNSPSAEPSAPLPLFDTARVPESADKTKGKPLKRTERTAPQEMQAEDAFE